MSTSTRNKFLAAAFMMATSAVGPGFLTQTAFFTEKLLASFGFVILVTVVLDIIAQLNIWRVIVVSEKRAQDIANELLPGMGFLLAGLVVLGGFAFNIGNIAGAGLGMNILFGMDVSHGAFWSALMAIGIFIVREAARVMDGVMKVLGILMILLTVFVAWQSNPPLAQAAKETVMPLRFDFTAILTLVGGSVGGYITFAGAHRLLDTGIKGRDQVKNASTAAVTGIVLASIMRTVLFLAVLGVVSVGIALDSDNPAASVFRIVSGEVGYKLFGLVLWSAAITSVIGAAYTSVSFVKSFHPVLQHYERYLIIAFIVISTSVFLIVGKPVQVLVLAGALNGLILPIALLLMLLAVHRQRIVGKEYKHPWRLSIAGFVVVLLMGYISVVSLIAYF
ncbi:NRAMP family divalent metal transporter [Olivibacter sitiensis]|uniref:NRAMP family divalent metal transporter n=1 Tax=Olivibacter sitiensis TaxID=376470 RepID=UPI0004195149|nr:NRAMP family divalent metal transporter [Olivibacter sitiensis]